MLLEVKDFHLDQGHGVEFKNVSFTLDRNECIAVRTGVLMLGTSLLQGLIGILENAGGEVWFQGANMVGPLPQKRALELREDIGFVFRVGGLISLMNVRENIALPLCYHYNTGRQEQREAVNAIAERLEIQDLLNRETDDLDVAETRMVNLARALIARPKLLMIDAILESMPTEQRERILGAISACQLQNGCGVLMTTREQTVVMASKIYELDQHGLTRVGN
jgi:ABC-type lipoprotein export system ATPase subunit